MPDIPRRQASASVPPPNGISLAWPPHIVVNIMPTRLVSPRLGSAMCDPASWFTVVCFLQSSSTSCRSISTWTLGMPCQGCTRRVTVKLWTVQDMPWAKARPAFHHVMHPDAVPRRSVAVPLLPWTCRSLGSINCNIQEGGLGNADCKVHVHDEPERIPRRFSALKQPLEHNPR